MQVVTTCRAEIRLAEPEWFRVRVHRPTATVTGVVEVRWMSAQWSSDHPRPTLALVGQRVRLDGHAGGVRVAQHVVSWRADGRYIVGQLPDAVVERLEALGMVIH